MRKIFVRWVHSQTLLPSRWDSRWMFSYCSRKEKKLYNYEILWWPLSNMYLLRTESRRQRKMLRNDSTIYLHLTPNNLINEPTRYCCAKLARYIGCTCRCHYICISYRSENPTKFFCSRYIPPNRCQYCVP